MGSWTGTFFRNACALLFSPKVIGPFLNTTKMHPGAEGLFVPKTTNSQLELISCSDQVSDDCCS